MARVQLSMRRDRGPRAGGCVSNAVRANRLINAAITNVRSALSAPSLEAQLVLPPICEWINSSS
jgi:hypothetical protein